MSAVEGGDVFCQGRFERSLKVTGPAELAVEAGSGHINVSTGDDSVVRVRGTIIILRENLPVIDAAWRTRIFESHPPLEQHDNIIKIGQASGPDLNRKISISYDLVVPLETRLSAVTGSGSITVDGLHSRVDAAAGCGAITLSEIRGDARVSAGSGEVELQGINGDVEISTGSGPIRVAGISGNLRAATASGDVVVIGNEGGAPPAIRVIEVSAGAGNIRLRNAAGIIRARTVSGLIRIEGENLAGAYTVETVSGEIVLLLNPSSLFDVRARTVSGRIASDRPITVGGAAPLVEPVIQSASVCARLSVATVSGNIDIH